MNKKLIPAISIGIAVLLIGSIAYAADRRKNSKNLDRLDNNVHEEEMLKAELYDALVQPEIKPEDSTHTTTVAAISLEDLNENIVAAKIKR